MLLVTALILSGCAKTVPELQGGILKIRFDKAAAKFGYPVEIKAADREYANMSLERLLRGAEGAAVEPQLATSWELSPDRTYYTFHLREGVKFHDGTPFNAEAAKWNLDNVLACPMPIIRNVTSVEIVDDYTIRLNISKWDNLTLHDLAVDPTCMMASPTAVEKNGVEWALTHPVGTGPFKFKEYERNIVARYERYDDYWDGAPYLDGTEILIIPDRVTALASLKAGEVQVLLGLDPPNAANLRSEGYYKVMSTEGLHLVGVFESNNPNSIWADKRVRQALEYAVDKETICDGLGYGIIHPVYQVIYGAPDCPDKVPRKYDPDKARELLADAGHPDGFKCKLIGPVFANRDFPIAIQSYLAEVGVDLELEFLERAAFMSYRFGQTGLGNNWLIEPEPGGGDVLYSANSVLSSSSHLYPSTARPAGFDELLKQAVYEPDPDKVTELLIQMEMLLYNDAMLVPFWNEGTSGAFDPALQDYEWFRWGGPDYDLSKAWLEK